MEFNRWRIRINTNESAGTSTGLARFLRLSLQNFKLIPDFGRSLEVEGLGCVLHFFFQLADEPWKIRATIIEARLYIRFISLGTLRGAGDQIKFLIRSASQRFEQGITCFFDDCGRRYIVFEVVGGLQFSAPVRF
jgi:hypothetical protein